MRRTTALGLIALAAWLMAIPPATAEETRPFTRTDSDFISHGKRCAAWLYLPRDEGRPPVVVMAHGFGGERDFRLPAFAERFAARGMAVLLFDYRNFGASEGEPRNWISPSRHLEDWQAAITHVRGLATVDAGRIALWGTSFSGGHVLVTAAEMPGIAAVVAQVPFVDGIASAALYPPSFLARAVSHAAWDGATMAAHQPPHNVPIVGTPEEFAVLNKPDSMAGVEKLIPPGAQISNFTPARIFVTLPFYRPINSAGKIKCPVLIIYGANDTLIPPAAVEKTVARIRDVKVVKLPVGHFDVYTGEEFETVSKIEADFLVEKLRL